MPKLLSASQVEAYARDGYVSPIDVLSAEEVRAFRDDLEDWEKQRGQTIDFPEPGGPIRIMLCPPAAAISKARFTEN